MEFNYQSRCLIGVAQEKNSVYKREAIGQNIRINGPQVLLCTFSQVDFHFAQGKSARFVG